MLITDRIRIFSDYLKSWLIIDLLATFPGTFLDLAHLLYGADKNEQEELEMVVWFKFLRILRFERFFEFLESLLTFEKFHFKAERIKLFSFVLAIFIILHLIACMWFQIAISQDFAPGSWIMRYHGYVGPQYHGTNYITTFYFALNIMTTIGYGDFTPNTNSEIILGIVTMVIGIGFYANVIGVLHSIM